MLDLMRRKAQSPYLQATMVIIILVFIFWGVGNQQGNGPNVVMTVNDVPVTYQEYQKTYDQTLNRYRDQFGGTIPKALLDSLDIKGQTLNRLAEQILVRQEADRLGIHVSDAEVRDNIEKISSFQTNGVFNINTYRDILAASRLTVEDFEASVRNDLLSQKVVGTLTRFGWVPEHDLASRFAYDNEQRKLRYARFTADSYLDEVKVADEALAAWFEENKDKYKSAQQRSIQYLAFQPANFGDLAVGDDEARADYDASLAQYSEPEKRRARHILFKVDENAGVDERETKRKEAEEVLTKARAGDDFAGLATLYSGDSSAANGGDLGFFTRGRMVKPFEDTVFAMNPGEVSGIVETQFGYHIIKLEEITPATVRPFEEVKEEIVARLRERRAKETAQAAAAAAYEQIIMAGSLAKYVEQGGGPLQETGFFEQASPPAGIAASPAFVSTAFSLNKGELSSLVELPEGSVILYVADIREPEVPALETVRERVQKDFVAGEAKKLAAEKAKAMLAAVGTGKDFAEAAKEAGVAAQDSPLISRNARFEAALPPPVVDAGLTLSEDNPLAGEVVIDGSDAYVVAFGEKMGLDDKVFEEKRQEYADRIKAENTNALVAAWVASLREKAEIKTEDALL
ncbi:MAG: SurA N-terminal domain-containing protein [Thermodesulfobacteriota bacterium]